MSFWSVFGGGNNNADDLPSAGPAQPRRTRQETPLSPGAPLTGPPPIATLSPGAPSTGPPPTAPAYMHSPQPPPRNVVCHTPAETKQSPKFQIFQPKADHAAEKHGDEPKDETHVIAAVDDRRQHDRYDEPECQPVPKTPTIEDSSADEPAESPVDDWTWDEPSESESASSMPNTKEATTNMPPRPEFTNADFVKEKEVTLRQDVEDTNNVIATENDYAEANYNDDEELVVVVSQDDSEFVVIATQDENVASSRSSTTTSPSTLAKVVSPTKLSRFNFIVNESIPEGKLEEYSTKRRYEFRTRVFELDCQLAGLQARCIEEGILRHTALKHIFPHLSRRLERIAERYLGSALLFDEERNRILTIQRRVCSIHNKMVKNKCETLTELQEEVFESLHLEMLQSIQPSIQIEAQKADKREGTRFLKFDSLAGTVARRFQEESATRKAAIVLLQGQIDLLAQPENKVNFLEQLRTLRMTLKEERETRRARDAQILNDVHQTCNALRRAVLEAAGATSG